MITLDLSSLRQKWIFFAVALLLVVVREINLLLEPRFWAEEGVIFYSFAYQYSIWDIMTTILVGYYVLLNVIVTSIQKLFPMEYAPLISTTIGLMVQMVPVAIVLFYNSRWWNTGWKKIVVVLFCIICSPPELWINTTNSHFYFGLITLLIVLTNTESLTVAQIWFLRFMLFMGGMTGPASTLVAPGFWWKSYKQRDRETLIQTAIITACGITQAIIVVYSALYNNQVHRFTSFTFGDFVIGYIRDAFGLLLPFGTKEIKVMGLVVAPLGIWLLIKSLTNSSRHILIITFFSVTIMSALGSLGMMGGFRYSLVPTIILILLMLEELSTTDWNAAKWSYKFLRGFFVVYLTLQVFFYQRRYKNTYSIDYPHWKEEVNLWKQDHTHKLRVHPYSEAEPWAVDLNRNWKKK